jgi:hypothetical protein
MKAIPDDPSQILTRRRIEKAGLRSGIHLSVTKRDHEITKVQSTPGQINIFRRDERFRVQSRDGVGVASRWSSIGIASGRGNLCAGSYWSGGIPNVIGSRRWRRELPLGGYSVS